MILQCIISIRVMYKLTASTLLLEEESGQSFSGDMCCAVGVLAPEIIVITYRNTEMKYNSVYTSVWCNHECRVFTWRLEIFEF